MSEPAVPPPPPGRHRTWRGRPGRSLRPARSSATVVEVGFGIGALVLGAFLLSATVIVAVTFFVFAAILLVGGASRIWRGRFWGDGTLQAPTGSVALNDRFTVGYRLDAKSSQATEQAKMRARLVCEERATYTQGTDRVTVTDKRYNKRLSLTQRFNDLAMEALIDVEMPGADYPASMDLRNNDIQWRIEVKVTAPEAPDMEQRFALDVRPEIVSEPSGWRPQ